MSTSFARSRRLPLWKPDAQNRRSGKRLSNCSECARSFAPASLYSGVEERLGYFFSSRAFCSSPCCAHLSAREALSFFAMKRAVMSDSNAERPRIETSHACPADASVWAARTVESIFVRMEKTTACHPEPGIEAFFSSNTARIMAINRWQEQSAGCLCSRALRRASSASWHSAAEACSILSAKVARVSAFDSALLFIAVFPSAFRVPYSPRGRSHPQIHIRPSHCTLLAGRSPRIPGRVRRSASSASLIAPSVSTM